MLEIPAKQSLHWRYAKVIFTAIGTAVLCFAVLHSWQLLTANSTNKINIATADTGDVVAIVSAQGKLLPRQSHSVMAQVDGVILQLAMYPGAEIKPGDVLLTMRNPLLERDREQAELEVLAAKAAQEAALARLERENIALENEVAIQAAEIRYGEQELGTMQTLLDQQILARLEYLRAQTKLEQARLRHNLSLRNIEAFQRARQADERSFQYQLQQAEKKLAMVAQDIQHLQIKADSAGLLNELAEQIEVGKPVRRGDIVAQVNDPTTLYADLLIAATEASRVRPGQQVQVQIRDQQVLGEVLRVHPSVQHGQIRVEVLLPAVLPALARANLDISASIVTASAQQVVRVLSPLGVAYSQSTVALFVQTEDGFTRQQVQVGVLGQEYMEVISGLQPGQQILLDAPKQLLDQSFISLKELQGG
jgi:multidrug resistance efflux pump